MWQRQNGGVAGRGGAGLLMPLHAIINPSILTRLLVVQYSDTLAQEEYRISFHEGPERKRDIQRRKKCDADALFLVLLFLNPILPSSVM